MITQNIEYAIVNSYVTTLDTTGVDGPCCVSQDLSRSFRAVFFLYFSILSGSFPISVWTFACHRMNKYCSLKICQLRSRIGFPANPGASTNLQGQVFEDPHVPTCLPVLLLKMSASTGFTRPACLTGWCWIFDEMKFPKFHPKHITQSEGKLQVIWNMDSKQVFKTVNGFGLQKSINCPDNDVHVFSRASKGNSYHRLANNQLSLRCQTHQLYSIVISSHVLGLPSCSMNNLYHLCIMAVFSFSKIYVALPASAASICPSCSVGSFLCLAIKAFQTHEVVRWKVVEMPPLTYFKVSILLMEEMPYQWIGNEPLTSCDIFFLYIPGGATSRFLVSTNVFQSRTSEQTTNERGIRISAINSSSWKKNMPKGLNILGMEWWFPPGMVCQVVSLTVALAILIRSV